MRIRNIAIIAALIMLLASCSDGGPAIQISSYDTAGATAVQTATQTAEVTPIPTVSEPTPTPTAEVPTPEPSPTVKLPDIGNDYIIIVDKEDNAFGIFECGEDGKPGLLVDTFPCALGRSNRMTPTGTYKTGEKQRWKKWPSNIYAQYSPYATYYTYGSKNYKGGLYIHGPEYTEEDPSKLFVKTYNAIGTNCTSGCVRTTTAGAYWVYTFCKEGTVIEIVKSSDLVSWPGLPEIDPEHPKWDPTDPSFPD